MTAPFEAQFETVGADVFYRRHGKGPPIRIDPKERDAFVAVFARWARWSYIALMSVMLIGAGLLVAWSVSLDREPSGYAVYIGAGILVVLFIGGNQWAFNAPARALQYRIPSGAPLSSGEIQRRQFERMTWSRLAGSAAFALLMPFGLRHVDVLHGWGRLWLVVSAGLFVLIAVQAFRKWRHEAASSRGPTAGR